MAGDVPGREVDYHGVRIIGIENYPGRVALDASKMYANNLYNMIAHFWDKELQRMALDRNDEIAASCQVTGGGNILPAVIRSFYDLEDLDRETDDGNAVASAVVTSTDAATQEMHHDRHRTARFLIYHGDVS